MNGGLEGTDGSEQTNDDPTVIVAESAKIESFEGNVVCSLFVLVTGIVLDALCALPGALLADVPASLRTTSLVLVVLLGSPPVFKTKRFVLEQRIILAILLGTSAFVGMNKAEVTARNADGLFSLVGSLASVVACATNGVMLQSDSQERRQELREHLSALTGSMLFYVGMRCMRNAFSIPGDVLSFSVSHSEFDVRGYGVANEVAITGLAFSGCIISSFGIIVLLNHDMIVHTGSNGLSVVSAILACCSFVGAFAVQLSSYSLMESVPALFSDAACDGEYEYCREAYRSRRLFVATNNSSVAWIGTLAIATFAFSNVKRFTTRRDHFAFVPNMWASTSVAAIVSALGSLFVTLWFADVTRSMNYSVVELTLLLVSIPSAILSFPISACVLHVSGQAIYVFTRVYSENGFTLLYFTHHSIMATFLLTIAVLLLSSISYFLYTYSDYRMYSEPIERVNGVLLTMLVSVQFFLTVATMCMSSGYTGIKYTDDNGSWRVSGYEFSVQHSVSFFFCAALYATRYEHAMLPAWLRRLGWFLFPPVLGITWTFCILVLSNEGSPYQQWVDLGSFLIGVSAAVFSWIGVGVFLHT